MENLHHEALLWLTLWGRRTDVPRDGKTTSARQSGGDEMRLFGCWVNNWFPPLEKNVILQGFSKSWLVPNKGVIVKYFSSLKRCSLLCGTDLYVERFVEMFSNLFKHYDYGSHPRLTGMQRTAQTFWKTPSILHCPVSRSLLSPTSPLVPR